MSRHDPDMCLSDQRLLWGWGQGSRPPLTHCHPGLCHQRGHRGIIPSHRPGLWHDPTMLGVPGALSSCWLTRHLHACHRTVAGGVTDVAPGVARLRPTDGELPQHPMGFDLHPLTRLHLLAVPEPAHGGIGPGELISQHQVLPGHQAAMLHGAHAAHNGHRWLWDWRDGLSPQEQQPVLGAAMAGSCPDLHWLQLGSAGVSTDPPHGVQSTPCVPPTSVPMLTATQPSPTPSWQQPGTHLSLCPTGCLPQGPPAHLPR